MARLAPTVLVVLVVASAGCGRGGVVESPSPTAHAEERTIKVDGGVANYRGKVDLSAGQEPVVEMGDFFFSPTVIAGRPGRSVTLRLGNSGSVPHTFTIENVVNQEVEPGQVGTVTVTMPTSGSTVFFCAFHAAQGMRGVLGYAADAGIGKPGEVGPGDAGGPGEVGPGDAGGPTGPGGYGY